MVARPIRVVQMLPELKSGGVERGTLELSRFLVEQGQQSLVISQGGPMVGQLEREGGCHLRMPHIGEKTPRSLLHWLPLRRLLRQARVDILHLRSRLPAWIGYLAWKSLPSGRRPKLVTTFHGFYSVNGYSAVMTKGERIIAISKAVSVHIQRCYRVPGSRISIIYRGIDAGHFHPDRVNADRVKRIKDRWALRDNVPLLLLPGRVTYWKGHEVFLKALARLSDLRWQAVCVGAFDPRSAHFMKMKRMIDDLHLSDLVQFVGHEGDMAAVYRAADLVISAATGEPEAFGRTSIEAQAMGRPVIATAHGGSLETVVDGHTGWLVKPGNSEEMADAIRHALSRPELCVQLGANGLKRAHTSFTTRDMCRRTLALYRQLLSQ